MRATGQAITPMADIDFFEIGYLFLFLVVANLSYKVNRQQNLRKVKCSFSIFLMNYFC